MIDCYELDFANVNGSTDRLAFADDHSLFFVGRRDIELIQHQSGQTQMDDDNSSLALKQQHAGGQCRCSCH